MMEKDEKILLGGCSFTFLLVGGAIILGIIIAEINNKVYQKNKYLLEGIVYDERYMPAGGGRGLFSSKIPSEYSFSMDTKYGRKSIEVKDNEESLDAMINKGTRVQVGIYQCQKQQQNYKISSYRIKVLGEELK